MQQGLQYKNTLFLPVKSWSFIGLGFYAFKWKKLDAGGGE
ncbi:hypothetical protein SAMN05421593_4200 [Chryseobacterium culicis]|jgi:hypothetical protein|uniref:Uncharacterized protein n=1 Tax=Chryseobacterium culicis TaxID=680127 RepID=A0A1H6I8N8_CHRCI|nr:hypothetical protein SAMN05421593_4200 [Chryseobacterium culicis]